MFSNEIVLQLLDYLDSNLYKKISLDDLSNTFHYHKDYLMRLFKRELGITIIDYLNRKKIYHSIQYMRDFHRSATYLSIKFGFSSLEYYSEIFKKYIGVAPTVYYKYLNRDFDLGHEQFDIVNQNLVSLQFLWKRIDEYRLNVKPQKAVKVLSVFK